MKSCQSVGTGAFHSSNLLLASAAISRIAADFPEPEGPVMSMIRGSPGIPNFANQLRRSSSFFLGTTVSASLLGGGTFGTYPVKSDRCWKPQFERKQSGIVLTSAHVKSSTTARKSKLRLRGPSSFILAQTEGKFVCPSVVSVACCASPLNNKCHFHMHPSSLECRFVFEEKEAPGLGFLSAKSICFADVPFC